MVRIHITAAAYAALANGRDPDSLLPAQGSPQSGFFIWLAFTMAKLKAARGPSESYSEAIIRLAAEGAA